jgi:hypothetical protein
MQLEGAVRVDTTAPRGGSSSSRKESPIEKRHLQPDQEADFLRCQSRRANPLGEQITAAQSFAVQISDRGLWPFGSGRAKPAGHPGGLKIQMVVRACYSFAAALPPGMFRCFSQICLGYSQGVRDKT